MELYYAYNYDYVLFKMSGALAGDQSGYAVGTVGDYNGNGIVDFIVGAPYATRNGKAEVGNMYI